MKNKRNKDQNGYDIAILAEKFNKNDHVPESLKRFINSIYEDSLKYPDTVIDLRAIVKFHKPKYYFGFGWENENKNSAGIYFDYYSDKDVYIPIMFKTEKHYTEKDMINLFNKHFNR